MNEEWEIVRRAFDNARCTSYTVHRFSDHLDHIENVVDLAIKADHQALERSQARVRELEAENDAYKDKRPIYSVCSKHPHLTAVHKGAAAFCPACERDQLKAKLKRVEGENKLFRKAATENMIKCIEKYLETSGQTDI